MDLYQPLQVAPLRQAPTPHPVHRLPHPSGLPPNPRALLSHPNNGAAGEIFSAVGIYITRSAPAPRDLTSLELLESAEVGSAALPNWDRSWAAKPGPELGLRM